MRTCTCASVCVPVCVVFVYVCVCVCVCEGVFVWVSRVCFGGIRCGMHVARFYNLFL